MDACRVRGFTLLQLLIAMSVVGIGSASAIPALGYTIAQNRLQSSTNLLMHTFILARSEAIKRNGRITIKPNSENWTQGWIAFEDSNRNAEIDEGEDVLLEQAALGKGMTISANRPVEQYVSYIPSGQTEKVNGAIQMGTLSICSSNQVGKPPLGRAVIISSTGRPRIDDSSQSAKRCA